MLLHQSIDSVHADWHQSILTAVLLSVTRKQLHNVNTAVQAQFVDCHVQAEASALIVSFGNRSSSKVMSQKMLSATK